jgi:carbon starvation protein
MLEGYIARGVAPPGVASVEAAGRMVFNDRLDAAVAAFFMAAVVVIIVESARVWAGIVSGRIAAKSTEVEFNHLRDFAVDSIAS